MTGREPVARFYQLPWTTHGIDLNDKRYAPVYIPQAVSHDGQQCEKIYVYPFGTQCHDEYDGKQESTSKVVGIIVIKE